MKYVLVSSENGRITVCSTIDEVRREGGEEDWFYTVPDDFTLSLRDINACAYTFEAFERAGVSARKVRGLR